MRSERADFRFMRADLCPERADLRLSRPDDEKGRTNRYQLQKRYMVRDTQCPYVSLCWHEMMSGAAAPEGPMTYDST